MSVDRHDVSGVCRTSQDGSNPQSYSLGSRGRSWTRPRCTRLAYRVSQSFYPLSRWLLSMHQSFVHSFHPILFQALGL